MVIELIRAIYDSTIPLPLNEEYYLGAIEDIEFFGISSQIYHLLKQNKQLEYTPPFFQERLKQKYTKALYQNLFIKNQTELILREFEKVGIEVIPLKGVWFAEKYFGRVGARATSDIDILIKHRDLQKAIDCVRGLGFNIDNEYIPGHFHCTYSMDLPYSPIPLNVEIHWDLLKKNSSNFNIEEFWNSAKKQTGSTTIFELSDLHIFYMIVLHGWRHNMDSLKYFIDIIQLIHIFRNKINYKLLFKMAIRNKTYKRIIRTLSIVYWQFPELDDVLSLPVKRKIVLWDKKHFKNEKRTIKKYIDYLDYQINSYDSLKLSLRELYNSIPR